MVDLPQHGGRFRISLGTAQLFDAQELDGCLALRLLRNGRDQLFTIAVFVEYGGSSARNGCFFGAQSLGGAQGDIGIFAENGAFEPALVIGTFEVLAERGQNLVLKVLIEPVRHPFVAHQFDGRRGFAFGHHGFGQHQHATRRGGGVAGKEGAHDGGGLLFGNNRFFGAAAHQRLGRPFGIGCQKMADTGIAERGGLRADRHPFGDNTGNRLPQFGADRIALGNIPRFIGGYRAFERFDLLRRKLAQSLRQAGRCQCGAFGGLDKGKQAVQTARLQRNRRDGETQHNKQPQGGA